MLTLYKRHGSDGRPEYIVKVNGENVLKRTNIPNKIDYSIHEQHATKEVKLRPNDIIQVPSMPHQRIDFRRRSCRLR